MRSLITMVMGLLVAGLSVGVAGEDAKKLVKEDLKKFQGTWQCTRICINNADLGDDLLRVTTITIKDKKYVLQIKDKKLNGSFTIDPSKTPKQIDAVLIQDGEKKEYQGVYAWIGDRRKTCFALPGYVRPGDFMQETGYVVLEWEAKKKD